MSQSDSPAAMSDRPSHVPDTVDAASSGSEQQSEPAPLGLRDWCWGFVQRSFLILGIYILSIGPMYWHWYGARFAGGSKIFAAIYEPIFVLAALIPPFGRWMDWYVGLWIG